MVSARRIAHQLASITFLAALGLAFAGGLIWALSPDVSTGFTITEGGAAAPATPGAEDDAAPEPGPPTPAAEPTPTPTPEPTPDEELIAAAREPAATTVQVLDAGGGAARTNAAATQLADELGYQVINVTSARVDVARTTVWYTSGNEAEARALRERAPRVSVVEANRGLNEGTDLHVLVGPDWNG